MSRSLVASFPSLPTFVVPVALAAFLAVPTLADVVVLKDGRLIEAKGEYERRGDQVWIVLTNGTTTSLPASEVDFPKTEAANRDGVQGARVIETTADAPPPPPPSSTDPSLSDVLASRGQQLSLPEPRRRESSSQAELPRTPAGFLDLMSMPRSAYLDAEVTSELLRYLKGQGLDQVKLFQGSREDRPFLEIVANSEASVFKALKDGANALVQLHERFPDKVGAFELLMVSDSQVRSGQFVLTPELASELASGALDAPSFFLRHVQF